MEIIIGCNVIMIMSVEIMRPRDEYKFVMIYFDKPFGNYSFLRIRFVYLVV